MTEKCIVCLAKATSWSGHVHKKDGTTTFAGRCKDHMESKSTTCDKYDGGCYGDWTEEMGEDGYPKGLGYIASDGFNEEDYDE